MIQGLPERLQQLRTKYDFSQKQGAQKIVVSPSVVSGYETGERTSSTKVLLALSSLFQCSTDYLLGKQPVTPSTSINADGLKNKEIQAICTLIESIKDN